MGKQFKTKEPDVINNQMFKQHRVAKSTSIDLTVESPANDLLKLEKDEDFFNYLNWLGLAKKSGLIVLSSEHHYFYDKEDLKNIKTVVNIMPLNKIDNLKQFLGMIFNLIQNSSCFAGCFRDDNKGSYLFSCESYGTKADYFEHGILSKIPLINIINNLLDKRTNKYLSKKNVTFILENQGFEVLDMTELNGLTYFYARKMTATKN